jgi:hypothetical protein
MHIHLALCLTCSSFPLNDISFASRGETANEIPDIRVQ